MKMLAGSILVGFSLLSGVLNEWARRFYYPVLYTPDSDLYYYAEYNPFLKVYPHYGISIFGHGIDFFIVLRVLIGFVFVLGVALIVYGFSEFMENRR